MAEGISSRLDIANENIFGEFLGHEVKAPYRDGSQYNIARGKLVGCGQGFIKITGKLGTIVINERNIIRISKSNDIN